MEKHDIEVAWTLATNTRWPSDSNDDVVKANATRLTAFAMAIRALVLDQITVVSDHQNQVVAVH